MVSFALLNDTSQVTFAMYRAEMQIHYVQKMITELNINYTETSLNVNLKCQEQKKTTMKLLIVSLEDNICAKSKTCTSNNGHDNKEWKQLSKSSTHNML